MSDVTLEPSARPLARDSSLSSRFYFAAWRWHFYAGLFVAPFLVMLALTGLGRALHLSQRFHVNYPSCPTCVWTLSQDSMSNESVDPTSGRTQVGLTLIGLLLLDLLVIDRLPPIRRAVS